MLMTLLFTLLIYYKSWGYSLYKLKSHIDTNTIDWVYLTEAIHCLHLGSLDNELLQTHNTAEEGDLGLTGVTTRWALHGKISECFQVGIRRVSILLTFCEWSITASLFSSKLIANYFNCASSWLQPPTKNCHLLQQCLESCHQFCTTTRQRFALKHSRGFLYNTKENGNANFCGRRVHSNIPCAAGGNGGYWKWCLYFFHLWETN